MENFKCAFKDTLIGHQFSCEKAMKVVRRDGPSIACSSKYGYERCEMLHQRMKQIALPAFSFLDSDNDIPHSVLLKIQFGGLLGLQRLLSDNSATDKVINIYDLLDQVFSTYTGIENIPFDQIINDTTKYQLKRRHPKNK